MAVSPDERMLPASTPLAGMMLQTMRWFGPRDPVSLSDIRQAGCTGVVTALHEVANGDVWTIDAIRARQAEIVAAGMEWAVVESLPVHEAIKTQSAGWQGHVAAYRESLANLAECGLRIVTYNFMPVLDWTRTDLAYELPDGARALRFEMAALSAYDLHILKRPGAARDYDAATIAAADARFATMDDAARATLERTVAAGLPGSEESFTGTGLLQAIDTYAGIDADRLRAHHIAFLRAICPDADRLGIRLVVHPDDPPFPLFGLPRVVSTEGDLAALFAAVPNPSNGLCLCTGSLGIRPDNDLPGMARRLGDRIHFVHLRNTRSIADGEFHESEHLSGSVDMYAVVAALHDVARTAGRRIAMRPDHGHQMLDDLHKTTNPGYSAIGRLRGLAELRGLELGIARSVGGACEDAEQR